MAKVKSARHHWWPKCVSRFWADSDGLVNRLSPDGEIRRAPPGKFGAIGNAHIIRLSKDCGKESVWDEDFEEVFARADNAFADVIAWLDGLDRVTATHALSRQRRFHAVDAPEERLRDLVECLVSLAVRSPMNREAAVSLAEHYRGPLQGRERNALIGLNMRHCQRRTCEAIGIRGKFAVLYSPKREFIFGDGFFHNITSPWDPPMAPRILVPLTPDISVLHAIPGRYRTEPRVATLVLTEEEAEFLNDTVLIYSRNEAFFRSQKPVITEEFREAAHRRYKAWDHPVERLIHDIPGVSPLNL